MTLYDIFLQVIFAHIRTSRIPRNSEGEGACFYSDSEIILTHLVANLILFGGARRYTYRFFYFLLKWHADSHGYYENL